MTAHGIGATGRGGASARDAGAESQRQAVNHCPFCGEETLFPREGGGWDCRSCARAFSVTFHGLVDPRSGSAPAPSPAPSAAPAVTS